MTTWKELNAEYESDRNDFDQTENLPVGDINSRGDINKETPQNYFEVVGICSSAIGLVCDIILPHPFIVIRRQCQLSNSAFRYHWTPFTVIRSIYKMVKCQGFISLWKGIGSSACLKMISFSSDTLIGDIFNLPKSISRHSNPRKITQNILLKIITGCIVAPFYAACVLDTVQSDMASGPPNILNFFTEAFHRMSIMAKEPVSRLLPIWQIVPSVSFYLVVHYAFRNLFQFTTSRYLHHNKIDIQTKQPNEVELEEIFQVHYIDVLSGVCGSFAADVLLYPLELVVNRLCIQGTRILIDNIDQPHQLLPVTTSYNGVRDAFNTIINETNINLTSANILMDQSNQFHHHLHVAPHPFSGDSVDLSASMGEGSGSLYRGFGALVLQYSVEFLLLYGVKYLFEMFVLKQNLNQFEFSDDYSNAASDAGFNDADSVATGPDYDHNYCSPHESSITKPALDNISPIRSFKKRPSQRRQPLRSQLQ